MGILLWLLFEFLGRVVLELVLDILLAPVRAFEGDRRAGAPAAVWLLFVGSVLGGLSCLVAPERLLGPAPLPGMSLVVLPVLGGVTMWFWGSSRRHSDKRITHLATWYGGASFALGYALGRLAGLAFAADVRAV